MSLRFVCLMIGLLITPLLSAHAGQIFPPVNAPASGACPDGAVLAWTGDSVICADPSPGVTIATCPVGQSLVGISGGQPICRANEFGGIYTTCINGGCRYPNPRTGACSCPSGTTPHQFHDFVMAGSFAYLDCGNGIYSFACY